MNQPYILAIYPPGQTETPLEVYGSDRPFLSIRRGDLLHPAGHDFEHSTPGDPLHRVTAVVHLVFGGSERDSGGKVNPQHRVSVYTEEVEDSPHTLLG